jgi:hypothetical protein
MAATQLTWWFPLGEQEKELLDVGGRALHRMCVETIPDSPGGGATPDG